ncbi:MAG: hypothetical protein GZ086_13665 [Gelidibacter sp.]|nr:hypothetical protein [Gelidibacter sp.]
MSFWLLITVAIFTSCEKETTTLPENSQLNVQETKTVDLKDIKSVGEAILAGVDIQTYLNSIPKRENTASRPALSRITENNGLNFFFNAEDMPCGDLPTESFDDADYDWYATYGDDSNILDENTDSYIFSPGDILPGISFESALGEWYGLYLWTDEYYNVDKALFENNDEDLIINFTNNNVTSVSMNVKSWYWDLNIYMDVYGDSGYLGTSSVYLDNGYEGEYWGVTSVEPITKIVMYTSYGGYAGVDNVSFGNCNDLDGDGVLNENDAHPNSDLRATVNIGGCDYPNIDNVLVKNGSTMMDQINDLVAQINAQYNGENYTYLHKMFMTKLAGITYSWRTARLITTRERSAISSCAWIAQIPYNMES